MKRSLTSAVALIALGLGAQNAQAQTVNIDFESGTPGKSVEGPGAIHPLLTIDSPGQAVVFGEKNGSTPLMYGAPSPQNTPGGCLGNPGGFVRDGKSVYGQGFGDAQKTNDFTFTFAENTVATMFSVNMLDFGDFNPDKAANHEVQMVAYDAKGAEVTRHVLSYKSAEVANPPEYAEAGDACLAKPGQPGNYTFRVQGQGIKKVRLHVVAGADPNIGFDNISFTTTAGEQLWLENQSNTPITSKTVLEQGKPYRLTMQGTYSMWQLFTTPGSRSGKPEPTPMFPSAKGANGLVGLDPEFLFAWPSGTAFNVSTEPVPRRSALIEVSVDGGKTWKHPTTKDAFNPEHKYTYELTGAGNALQVRTIDKPVGDNYGRVQITVQPGT